MSHKHDFFKWREVSLQHCLTNTIHLFPTLHCWSVQILLAQQSTQSDHVLRQYPPPTLINAEQVVAIHEPSFNRQLQFMIFHMLIEYVYYSMPHHLSDRRSFQSLLSSNITYIYVGIHKYLHITRVFINVCRQTDSKYMM